jgi:hypothetical protein
MNDYKTIRVIADIHCDGDIYIKGKDKSFHRIGLLGESSFCSVPNKFYLKAKKLIN